MDDVVATIYQAVADAETFVGLAGAIARSIGARSGIIQLFGRDGAPPEISFNHWSTEHGRYYLDTGMYQHDVWRTVATAPEAFNHVQNMDDAVPVDQFMNTVFYNEHFRRFGDDTVHCIGGMFNVGGVLGSIGVHRGLGATPFDEIEVAKVEALVPHLSRALELRTLLGAAAKRAALAESALDQNSNAVLILDARGRLLFANAAARQVLEASNGVALGRGGVRLAFESAHRRFTRAVAEACARRGGAGAAMTIPRPRGAPLKALIAPVGADGLTHALVVIHDPDVADVDRAGALRALYGLTPAVAEVMVALGRGLSPAEIAVGRGVSLTTIRTQVSQAIEQTDTRSIAELAALAASTPSLRA